MRTFFFVACAFILALKFSLVNGNTCYWVSGHSGERCNNNGCGNSKRGCAKSNRYCPFGFGNAEGKGTNSANNDDDNDCIHQVCHTNPCGNHGTCVTSTVSTWKNTINMLEFYWNFYECKCHRGFKGSDADITEQNPGGRCDTCAHGFQEPNCDVCADHFTGVDCNFCKPQFMGDDCDTCYPGFQNSASCSSGGNCCDECEDNGQTFPNCFASSTETYCKDLSDAEVSCGESCRCCYIADADGNINEDACIGEGEHSSVNYLFSDDAMCCPRPEMKIVGLGLHTASGNNPFADEADASTKPSGKVEEEELRRTNLVFRRKSVLYTSKDFGTRDVGTGGTEDYRNLYPSIYAEPSPWQRLQTTEDSRCNTELCLPGPCTFLDMNYFGYPLFNAKSETFNLNKNRPNSLNDLDSQLFLFADAHEKLLNQNGAFCCSEDSSNSNDREGCSNCCRLGNTQKEECIHNLNFVDGMSFCNPIFGSAVSVDGKKTPSLIQEYEKAFPFDNSVPVEYTPSEYAGVIIPSRRVPELPDHYFLNGKIGRITGGSMKNNGASCKKREISPVAFPRMCGNDPKRIGCIDKHTHGSRLDQKENHATFSLADPFLFNGIFIGIKDKSSSSKHHEFRSYRHIGVESGVSYFKHYAKEVRDDLIGYEGVKLTPESVGNRLFLNPAYRLDAIGLNGFLPYLKAFVGPTFDKSFTHENCFSAASTDFCDAPNAFNPWKNLRFVEATGSFTKADVDLTSDRWDEYFQSIGVNIVPRALTPQTNDIGADYLYKNFGSLFGTTSDESLLTHLTNGRTLMNGDSDLRQPGQTLNPYDVASVDNSVTCDWDPNNKQLPCHLRGNKYEDTLLRLFMTPEGTGFLTQSNDFEYYNPFFRPKRILYNSALSAKTSTFDTRCVYWDGEYAESGNRPSPTELHFGKGYCYKDGKDYAWSVAALVYALQKVHSEDNYGETFFKEDLCDSNVDTYCNFPAYSSNTNTFAGKLWAVLETITPQAVGDSLVRRINPGRRVLKRKGPIDSAWEDYMETSGKFKENIGEKYFGEDYCDLSVCDFGSAKHPNLVGTTQHLGCTFKGALTVATQGAPDEVQFHARDVQKNEDEEKKFVRALLSSHWIHETGIVYCFVYEEAKASETSVYCACTPAQAPKNEELTSCDVFFWATYMYIAPPRYHESEFKAVVDYAEASLWIQLEDKKITFSPSERDAGYSQSETDNNAFACDCDMQPITFKTTLIFKAEVDPIFDKFETERYNNDDDSSPFLLDSGFELYKSAYSWERSISGPNVGLYLGSSRRNVVVRERDLIPYKTDLNGNADINAMHSNVQTKILNPFAPSASEAVDNLIFDKNKNDKLAVSNLDKVHEVEFEYSCMRYPFGVFHRSQMSDNLRDELFKNKDGTLKTKFGPEALQGYCEKISGKYRFCANTRHSIAERDAFCTQKQTKLLATHFIYGLRVPLLTAETSCSAEFKVCLVVPGAALGAGNIKTYTSLREDIGIDFTGYTLMVAPFNATFLSRFLLRPRKFRMIANPTRPYMAPDPYVFEDVLENLLDVGDVEMMDTFGYNPSDVAPMLEMAGNLGSYLKYNNIMSSEKAVEKVEEVVNNFINKLFSVDSNSGVANYNCDLTGGDELNGYFVPDTTGDETNTRLCVSVEDILLPLSETSITVHFKDMTIRSAYRHAYRESGTVAPIFFKGIEEGATTCERFIVAAQSVKVYISVDLDSYGDNPASCNDIALFDGFKRTPVKLLGTDVSNSEISVVLRNTEDKDGNPLAMVAVAVLGSDSELFFSPKTLIATGLEITVLVPLSSTSQSKAWFDVGLARVVHPDHSAEEIVKARDVAVQCFGFNEEFITDDIINSETVTEHVSRDIEMALGYPASTVLAVNHGLNPRIPQYQAFDHRHCSVLMQGEKDKSLSVWAMSGHNSNAPDFNVQLDHHQANLASVDELSEYEWKHGPQSGNRIGSRCIERHPWDDVASLYPTGCSFIEISKYTSVFPFGFEQVEFPPVNHARRTSLVLTILLAIYLTGIVLLNIALNLDKDKHVHKLVGFHALPFNHDDVHREGENNDYKWIVDDDMVRMPPDDSSDEGEWVQVEGNVAKLYSRRGISLHDLYEKVICHSGKSSIPYELRHFVLEKSKKGK